MEHLGELRSRLLRAAAWWLGASALAGWRSTELLAFLTGPLGRQGAELHYLAPAEAFLAVVRMAMGTGLLLAFPFILREAAAFAAPALKQGEASALRRYLFPALAMPMLGAAFGWLLLPVAAGFFFGFGAARAMVPVITLSAWLGFVSATVGGAAAAFELPVVCALLAKIGVLTPAFFRQRGPHLVVLTFVIAALLTPPDVVSQLLLAGPILLLLWASAWIVGRVAPARGGLA